MNSKACIAALFALALSACAVTSPRNDEAINHTISGPLAEALDGAWSGLLTTRPPFASGTTPDEMVLDLSVHGEEAHVFLTEKGKRFEVMPGAVRMIRYHSNAILFA